MTQITDLENNECIVCVEGPEKGKLYNYNHYCGNYKIHQKCFHEWIIKEGNSCIICRKDAFENEETIEFLNLLLINSLRGTAPSIEYNEMKNDNIFDNQPNFEIDIENIYIVNLNMERLSEEMAINLLTPTREGNQRSLCYYFGFFLIILIGILFLIFG